MIDLGLKLNPSKTKLSNQVVTDAIKPDKLQWMCKKQYEDNPLKHLLIIHEHSVKFPNSGSLLTALDSFFNRIKNTSIHKDSNYTSLMPMISIAIDIAYHNPRTYPPVSAILSKFLSFIDNNKKQELIEKILRRFNKIPNTGYMDIWLQRIILPLNFAKDISFKESICGLVVGNDMRIWNSGWIAAKKLTSILVTTPIVDSDKTHNLPKVISSSEIKLYMSRNQHSS